MTTKTCLSCLKPVASLATRCPHCTTPLNLIGGSPLGSPSLPSSAPLGMAFFLCLFLATVFDSSTFMAISIVVIGLLALAARL